MRNGPHPKVRAVPRYAAYRRLGQTVGGTGFSASIAVAWSTAVARLLTDA
jgi:hypothetical protein